MRSLHHLTAEPEQTSLAAASHSGSQAFVVEMTQSSPAQSPPKIRTPERGGLQFIAIDSGDSRDKAPRARPVLSSMQPRAPPQTLPSRTAELPGSPPVSLQTPSVSTSSPFVPPPLQREGTIVLTDSAIPDVALPTDKDTVLSPYASWETSDVEASTAPASAKSPVKTPAQSPVKSLVNPTSTLPSSSSSPGKHPPSRHVRPEEPVIPRWTKPLLGLQPNQLDLYVDRVWSEWQSPNEPLSTGLARLELHTVVELLPVTSLNLLINNVQATEDQVRRLLISPGQTTDPRDMLQGMGIECNGG
jgi:hypothetical protein